MDGKDSGALLGESSLPFGVYTCKPFYKCFKRTLECLIAKAFGNDHCTARLTAQRPHLIEPYLIYRTAKHTETGEYIDGALGQPLVVLRTIFYVASCLVLLLYIGPVADKFRYIWVYHLSHPARAGASR